MKKALYSVFIVLTLVMTFAIGAFGQETTGIIEITSRDPNGAVVPNVSVTVVSAAGTGAAATVGFRRTVTTDENGFARMLQVPPGIYSITAAPIAGFAEKTLNGVQVVLGKPTPVNLELGITASTTNVEVSAGDVSPVDTTDSKIQTNISAQAAELLPKGTNFASILKISPATRPEPRSGQFQIDGASGSENTFIVDGQEVTNVRTGVLDSNSNLPFALIQEVQIKSSGFEAEYGGATGGVVSVVTKGGGNTFNGEFGVNFRPSGVNAIGRPVLRLTDNFEAEYYPQRRDDYYEANPIANLRGPILKDKLWFFAGYNPQIFNISRTLHYVDEADRTHQLFPDQTYEARQVNDYTFLRLDSQPFSKLRLTGSYIYNPISVDGTIPTYVSELDGVLPSQAGNPTFQGAEFLAQTGGRQNSQSFTGQGVWTPRNDLIIAARFGHYFLNEKLASYGLGDVTRARVLCSASSRTPFFPAGFGCTPGVSNGVTAFDGTVYDATSRNIFDADATWMTSFFGRHEFKGGMQNNGISNTVDTRFSDQIVLRAGWTVPEYSGRTSVSSLPICAAGQTTGCIIGAGLLRIFQTQGDVSSSNLGLFFQDKWQPTRRLTLNLGVRTEREDVPSFTPGLPGIKFDFADKIAPRLGVAYDLTGDGKTKVTAFYGWFYDRFKYELPRGSFGGDVFHDFYYDILPGQTIANFQNRAQIMGGGTWVPGGACPTGTNTPVFGMVRCDIDFRVPSNAGLPLTSAGGIDPDIKAFRQSEFTVGFERDLGHNYVARARYSYKNVDHAIEDAGFPNDQGSEYYIIGNPGEGLYASEAKNFGLNALKPKRRYDALEVILDRRFANDYYFSVNYTFSRLVGNYSGLASSDEEGRLSPNVNRFFDQPQAGWTVAGGPDNGLLNTDRPHVFKFFGAYSLDWNKRFGFGANNTTEFQVFGFTQSGTPLTSTVTVNGIDTVLTKRGDMGRTPWSSQIDFAIRHRFRFGKDNRFTLVGETDILNLFNWATPTNFSTFRTDSTFDVEELIPADQRINCAITGDSQPCLIAGYKIYQNQGVASWVTTAQNPAVQYPTYNLANSFQGPRQVRFGIRLLF